MWKDFTYRNALKYIDVSPKLLAGYNRAYYRSIINATLNVSKENEGRVWQTLYPSIARKPNDNFNFRTEMVRLLRVTFMNMNYQSVHVDEIALFRVEKVVRKRKRGGRTEYLVKWRGYPAKLKSWLKDGQDMMGGQDMMASYFYVTLPSNSSYEYFTHNTGFSFTTQLAEPIVLSGNWEVALCEIQYPFYWKNVTENNCSMLLNGRDICIPNGYYDTIKDVIYAFHDELTPTVTANVKMHLNKHSFKTAVKVKSLDLQGLSQMLGFFDYNKICKEGYNIGDVVLHVHNGATGFFG
ncbi:hypothetical protein BSL78_17225 [Apostichopus japonicus]|uniref:Chromo domain-containing protein n=1 Tax=Stichopus japonicus TaxID=307972 RepID=A0A2G8KD35_STIJA|nr:hypothetical protein BSL78_17225 [Apostichopus japonicus]